MTQKRTRQVHKVISGVLVGLVFLCLAGAAISALSNRSLPKEAQPTDRLGTLDRVRLEETFHLRAVFGNQVWLGMGTMEIPVSLHNAQYSYLTGFPQEPPAGWELVAGETFAGKPYYRKAESEPQNFAVLVGGTWVAGMATKSEMDQFIIDLYKSFLPGVLEPVFPYRLLIQSTEVQMGGVLHECFHVFQANLAPKRLEAAEKAHRLGESYWAAEPKALDLWKEEVSLLAKALEAKSDEEALTLSRQFLDHRAERRKETRLSTELIDYERQLEWEEGLAKYVELEFLRQASTASDYQPLEEMKEDPFFKAYRTFDQRWSQEILQMKLEANQDNETSFYYTGMAQAILLDRLVPGWKGKALSDGIYLEDLLKEAPDK